MTPAINLLSKHKTEFKVHEYIHDTSSSSYGEEAAIKLGISAKQVFKTLLVQLDNKELVVAILPVSKQLNLKLIAKSSKAKKAQMADKNAAMRTTGYLLGAISPLGQKKKLRTFIDKSAMQLETIYISAGKRGLEVELTAKDLTQLTDASIVSLAILI